MVALKDESRTPSNREVNEDDVAALLASELNELSLDERSQILEEIHGVEPVISETPELLSQWIQELREAIDSTPESERTAFELGRSISDYVTGDLFLLMFLRSERFDVDRAALKLLRFMEEKRYLFGSGEVLGRPLRLSDLRDHDGKLIRSGIIQVLSSRDSTGRCVLVDFAAICPKEIFCQRTPISYAKAIMFMFTAIAEGDVDIQKRGAVFVHYYVGEFNGYFSPALLKRVRLMFACVPCRFNSFHVCSSDPRFIPFNALGQVLLGKKFRLRVRGHHGSHTECQYHLMTYGIPVEALPISHLGEINSKYWSEWIARRQYKEEYYASTGIDFEGVGVPGAFDVLLRRGRIYNQHPGNIRYRQSLDSKLDAYQQASQKASICKDFVKEMQAADGSRFLKYEKLKGTLGGGFGWWWEVSQEEAARRVGKSMIYIRSLKPPEGSKPYRPEFGTDTGMFPISSTLVRTNKRLKV